MAPSSTLWPPGLGGRRDWPRGPGRGIADPRPPGLGSRRTAGRRDQRKDYVRRMMVELSIQRAEVAKLQEQGLGGSGMQACSIQKPSPLQFRSSHTQKSVERERVHASPFCSTPKCQSPSQVEMGRGHDGFSGSAPRQQTLQFVETERVHASPFCSTPKNQPPDPVEMARGHDWFSCSAPSQQTLKSVEMERGHALPFCSTPFQQFETETKGVPLPSLEGVALEQMQRTWSWAWWRRLRS